MEELQNTLLPVPAVIALTGGRSFLLSKLRGSWEEGNLVSKGSVGHLLLPLRTGRGGTVFIPVQADVITLWRLSVTSLQRPTGRRVRGLHPEVEQRHYLSAQANTRHDRAVDLLQLLHCRAATTKEEAANRSLHDWRAHKLCPHNTCWLRRHGHGAGSCELFAGSDEI
ncbi:hypothetical protein AGOR_G00002080 [Albula goreensis]|uniref:Uncharacterized protein n=1 Tax=Albula goreensis TaxID=1534307 RepID=A0A8T3E3P1_9TELE|nr:hypothetical protein AGOR_G00002080 [Albula goreensis]